MSAVAVRDRAGELYPPSAGQAGRLDGGAGPGQRGVHQVGAVVCGQLRDPVGGLREGAAQGRRGPEYLAGFTGTEGVLFIGRAQEKVPLFRTRKRRRADGSSYPWIAAETGVVNQYYCYCVDEDFGPFFLKFCSYFPFNAKLCINGNEWAKRQAAKAGIGFTPMDNAFAAVETWPPCRRSAMPWARRRSTRCCEVAGPAAAPVQSPDRAAGYR